MSSSESINFSKIKPENVEITDSNNKNKENYEKELSDTLPLENKEKPINLENEKNNNLDLNKNNDLSLEVKSQTSIHNLLYGNPIDCAEPHFLGKSFAFVYDFKGNPKITIGPDCKLIIFE